MLQCVMAAWVGIAFRLPARVVRAGLLVIALLSMAVPAQAGSSEIPEGVWLGDPNSAVQLFDCNGLAVRPRRLVAERT